jgi:Superfamily II DNA/RNA helicases, SNF2 family
MSDLLQQLLEQQAELAHKIAELQAEENRKQQEEIRIAQQQALTIPKRITFEGFQYGYLTIVVERDPWREDVMNALRNCRTRKFHSGNKNVIHVSELEQFQNDLSKLPNVEEHWKIGVKQQAEKWLNQPAYHIAIKDNKKEFVITLGPTANRNKVATLPSAKQDRNTDATISLSLTEGWRLIETLEKEPKVEYTNDAKEYILNQIKLRNSLNEIALMKDADYEVSFADGRQLRSFQKVGAKFIEATGYNALLADDTGLGKTFQTLAPAIKEGFKTIIVCPAKAKKNWISEVFRLTGKVPYYLQGGAPSNADIEHILIERPQIIIINYDILGKMHKVEKTKYNEEGVLVSYKEERWLWVELLNMYKADYVIYDEAHYLQNHDSNRSQASRLLKSPRNVPATATPLVNRPPNLWPILTLIDPEIFPFYEGFLARYTIDGKHPRNVEELREILRTRMIRRKKQDVMKDLPPLIPINDYQNLSPKAKKLYERVLQGVYQVVKEWNPGEAGAEKKVTNILVQIMRCKQICAIDKMESTADKAVELYDSSEGNEHRKVIIFSQFKPVVYGIAKRLGQEAIAITGDHSLDERHRLVWQFQNNPDVHFAVCSSKAVDEALTMTACGNMIFNDLLWHDAGHQQCIGRAYGRMNDIHGLGVFFEVCEDTIEEWIMDLIADKRDSNDQIIEGTVSSREDSGSVAMALIQKIKNSM